MRKGNRLPIRTLKLIGSRKSGKTTAYQIFAVYMLLINEIKGDIYLIRNAVQDANELFKEVSELVQELGIVAMETNQTKRLIKYNGKQIRILGLESNQGGKTKVSKAKLGLATGRNKDYAVIVFEEAYEIDETKTYAIEEAVRGYKYFLTIYASNPWTIMNWYIEQANNEQRFDERLLKRDSQQFKFIPKTRTALHYTTFKLNKYVSDDEKDQLHSLLRTDPQRARVSVLGMPGLAQGSVYGGYYEQIRPLRDCSNWYANTDYFVGGIDWGEKRDTTAAQLWAIGYGTTFAAGIDSYSHTNQSNPIQKTNRDMIADILDFYIAWSYKLPKMINQKVIIYVDYAAFGIIEFLNLEAKNRNASHWLAFTGCTKFPISDRIDHFTLAMSMGKIFLEFDNFKELCRELQNSQYDDKGKRLDINDHHINSKEYALANNMYSITTEFNDIAFRR